MKIVITNTVALNGGDAAILLALVRLLKEAFGDNVELVVFDSQPLVAARLYPELTFRELWHARAARKAGKWLRRVRRAWHLARVKAAARAWQLGFCALPNLWLQADERRDLDWMRDADLIVSTGGTYLVEQYSLRPRVFEFELALALNKPLILFTQSLGPFRDSTNARTLGRLLSRAAAVLVRDDASRRHLRETGVPEETVHVTADAAFALDPGPGARQRSPGGLRVAVSVREWPYFQGATGKDGMKHYAQAMSELVSHLVRRHGAAVTFLSTCQGVPEYRYDDAKVAAQIAESLEPPVRAHVTVNSGFHRPEQLIERLRDFDLTVATRMHMAILSLVAGTPVLPIAYEFKTTELFNHLGLGTWTQSIESIQGAALITAVDGLLAQLASVREGTRAAAAAERVRARSSAMIVKQLLADS